MTLRLSLNVKEIKKAQSFLTFLYRRRVFARGRSEKFICICFQFNGDPNKPRTLCSLIVCHKETFFIIIIPYCCFELDDVQKGLTSQPQFGTLKTIECNFRQKIVKSEIIYFVFGYNLSIILFIKYFMHIKSNKDGLIAVGIFYQ